ncbi:hypothetical protein FRB90_012146 [Tulasnella sp. 427]|nr:hypothetical protein FRB90_012146 [Tulasnella sp. 427]
MNSAHYTYVDQVNGNLVCCICRNPFIDPVSTTTCSHTFCSECIASALMVSQQCPVDRSPLTSAQLHPAATIVRNLVDELIVESATTSKSNALKRGVSTPCCEKTLENTLHAASIASWNAKPAVETHVLSGHHLQLCPYEAIKGFFAIHSARQRDLELENADLRRRLEDTERTVRSHQRDLDRAKVKLGAWFQPMGPETPGVSNTSGEATTGLLAASPNSTSSSAGTPTRPELRRRISVPFNPAVFDDTSDSVSSLQTRRSTVSSGAAPERHSSESVSSDGRTSFDDPYAGFTASNPMAHPILTGTGGAGPSTFYRAHSSNSNPVAPLNLSGSLEGTLASLRSSIVSLSQSLESLERKQDIMLTTETLRMHEDVGSLRAIVHGLRMQVHNIMMDRNTYFTRMAPTVPNMVAQMTQSLSRQPSSPNLATTSNATVGTEPTHRPSASVGGTSYTVSQFPLSSLTEGDSTQMLNQRSPLYYNLSPNIISSTVRRGPEGKL